MRSALVFGLGIFCLPIEAHDHEHGSTGLEFHENKGQWPQQVLYRALTPGGAVFVEPSAFTYVLRSGGPKHASDPGTIQEPLHKHAFRVHFEGGRAGRAMPSARRSHYANYFLGADRAKWAGGVGVYGEVRLQEVYDGIALRVHGEHGLKYDWVVEPGADAARIMLRYEGQDGLEVRDGMIYVRTSAGTVIEQRPVAWSETSTGRIPVRCEFFQDGDRVGYVFPDGYDRKSVMVIDPTVIFGSYSGSFANNFGFTATYDDGGHLYGGGIAFGAGYPVTLGVQQDAFAGDVIDMSITKFAPDGTSLIWSTYLGGGAGNESPHSMVANSLGELYVMGTSGSSDWPTTAGCFDATFGAGPAIFFIVNEGYNHLSGSDLVIAHLSADATQLLGSTYVGGSQADGLNLAAQLDYNYGDPFRGEIIMDQQERPVVVTSTISTDMPTSPGAAQPALGGGQDGYVCMLDPTLSDLLWATYIGGSADESAFGVQQGGDGHFYVTGGTTSTDLPMAGPAYQSSFSGIVDGYIHRYDATGALDGSTYLGTSAHDQSYFVQVDLAGNVYVVGQTHGVYPVSAGVYANPLASQFIHKLSGDLSSSVWSTRIGSNGTEDISPAAFLVSDCGQIYFSGWGGNVNNFGQPNFSTTVGLPLTPDAFQSTTDGSDFYLMVLNADAASLAYATYYGGTLSGEHVDGGTSRFDKNGVVYQAVCAGCWNNSDFPTTPGAWSATNNAGFNSCNLAVFKIDFEQSVQVVIDASITATGACITEPIIFSAVGTATDWAWDLGDGTLSTETTLAHLYDEPGTYTVVLIGTTDVQGLCQAVDTAYLEVSVVDPLVMQPAFSAEPTGSCDAASVQLFNSSTGSTSFIWYFGDNTVSTATNPVHAFGSPGVYPITLGVIDPVCVDTVFITQSIDIGIPGIELDLISPIGLCQDGVAILDAGTGFDTYAWSTGEGTAMITVSEAGTYTVIVTDGFCTGSDTVTVTPPVTYSALVDRDLCPGESAALSTPFTPQQVLWSNSATTATIDASLAGIYWYTAIDAFGCTVSDTVEVRVALLSSAEPIIPNVFTPNGDAVNEVFLPENIDAASFRMDVYNRWGMKVFSSASSTVGWNGKLDNIGETVPDGTYFVIITYKPYCANGAETTHTGHVTLLR